MCAASSVTKSITAYSFCLVPDGIRFGEKDRIYKYSYKDSNGADEYTGETPTQY